MLNKLLLTAGLFTLTNLQAASTQRPAPIETDFSKKCDKNGSLAKFLARSKMSPDLLQAELESLGVDTTSPKISLNRKAMLFLKAHKTDKRKTK